MRVGSYAGIVVALVASGLSCAGCKSSGKSAALGSHRSGGAAALQSVGEDRTAARRVQTAGPKTPTADSPPLPPPTPPLPAHVPQPPTPIRAAQAPEPHIAASPEDAAAGPRALPEGAEVTQGGARSDGRPEWWFSDARRETGMTRVCAEALGSDMAEARRAAVEAGRGRIRKALSIDEHAAVPGESIERVWVWPLPNSRVGPKRYAGYVLIAAVTDEPRSPKD